MRTLCHSEVNIALAGVLNRVKKHLDTHPIRIQTEEGRNSRYCKILQGSFAYLSKDASDSDGPGTKGWRC